MYNVTICFSSSDNWYGRLIRKITKGKVNHTFIEFSSHDWCNTQTIEIDNMGVRQVNSKRKHLLVKRFKPKKRGGDIILARSIRSSEDMIGKKYDWLAILGFTMKLLMWKFFFKRIKNPWHKANKMFCSEYVTKILQEARFSEVKRFNPEDVHPGFLMSVLENSKDWEEVEK